jgi:ribosomal protein L1
VKSQAKRRNARYAALVVVQAPRRRVDIAIIAHGATKKRFSEQGVPRMTMQEAIEISQGGIARAMN